MCQTCAAVPSHPTQCHFAGEIDEDIFVTTSADVPGDSSTGASISLGETLIGEFETTGDWDWIEVDLVAGETYTVTLDGFGTDPNDNPYLTVYAPGATTFSSATIVASDSNSGAGSEASVTFTATETGTFYIEAWDAYGDAGDYQVSVDLTSNTPVERLEEWTDQEISDQLTRGYWGGTARAWDTSVDNIITFNISSLSAAYQAFALQAFKVWSDIADLEFVATNGAADMTFQNTAGGAWASSSLSGSGGNLYITSSTINVQTGWAGANYTLQTFIHEIGHALGLGHAGGYNGSASYSQFDNGDADYLNDSWQASVMSYFSQTENTFVDASFAYLLTPMMADILAIVDLYGAATDTNLGASKYGYGNNTGNANYSADVLDDKGTNFALTIVDHGGYDTINLGSSTDDNIIDLTPGSFSSTGGLKGNLGIAGGTIIEKAIGGSGDDTLIGNDVANRLIGRTGSDVIQGGKGKDILAGGGGSDQLYGDGGADRLVGGGGSDQLFGGNGKNTLLGGGGNDSIFGGTHDDVLRGDAGADLFIFEDGFGADIIKDFDAKTNAEKIDLSAVSSISDWSDLSSNHMTQSGTKVIIDAGNGNTITLANVDLADLHSADFIF